MLDDVELIEVLANTKAKAKEVEQKLADAAEKQTEIADKREQYRPVATRGSVMSRKTVRGRRWIPKRRWINIVCMDVRMYCAIYRKRGGNLFKSSLESTK